MVEFPSNAHRERELTRLFKYGLLPGLRNRLEQIELQHPEGTNFDFHMYKRMLSATGSEANSGYSPPRTGVTAPPGVLTGLPTWKSSFQKIAVPVMAIGAGRT